LVWLPLVPAAPVHVGVENVESVEHYHWVTGLACAKPAASAKVSAEPIQLILEIRFFLGVLMMLSSSLVLCQVEVSVGLGNHLSPDVHI
jgi:hypothetical protein